MRGRAGHDHSTVRGFRVQDPEHSAPDPSREDKQELRIRCWQWEQLAALGYRSDQAAAIVNAAWMADDHSDLPHRLEQLVRRGATLEQAARIVAPLN